jgi:hypothetical protein
MIAAVVSRPRARRLLACAGAGLLAALPALAVGGAPAAAALQTVAGTPATATAPGLLTLYARNRAEGIPNYVTEDLLLIGYSLAAREATKALEDQAIRPRFADFIAALATGLAALPTATAAAQTPDATPAVTAQATQANRTYLAVLLALLGTDQAAARAALPAGPALAEFDLVVAAQGIAPSPLWGYPLDYGQFKPRGRYTEDPALAAYFRAMRYAGALLFPVQGSAATGVTPETAARMTVQALQLVGVIAADPRLKEQRDTLEGLLAWHFGPADDLSDADLGQVRAAHPDAAPAAVAQSLLAYAKTHGHQPRILGGLVDADRLEPGLTTRDVLTGWRLLPARYSADSAAFQRLVYDATGAYQGGVADADGTAPFGLAVIAGQPVKGYPTYRELLALLGSEQAASELKQAGEERFAGYQEAARDARKVLDAAAGGNGAHLRFLRDALAAPATDRAARDNAAAAFWTWQRYLDVLYAKQSYTVSGKGLELDPARPGATLEPSTDLYRALGTLVAEQQRQAPDTAPWQAFGTLLERVVKISEQHQPAADDQAFLNDLDRRLLALGGGTADTPIVVDIHVNPAAGQVVEEAIADAVVVRQGKARGARLSHREFKQPLDQRLDDAGWRARLAAEAKGP